MVRLADPAEPSYALEDLSLVGLHLVIGTRLEAQENCRVTVQRFTPHQREVIEAKDLIDRLFFFAPLLSLLGLPLGSLAGPFQLAGPFLDFLLVLLVLLLEFFGAERLAIFRDQFSVALAFVKRRIDFIHLDF